jgi:hypothetical protein
MTARATWRNRSILSLAFVGEARRGAADAFKWKRESLGDARHVWERAAHGMIADARMAMHEARRYRRMATQGGLRLP